jgi:methylated-DNA-[protein]-cysteine S-methyltransferase
MVQPGKQTMTSLMKTNKKNKTNCVYKVIKSPIGELTLIASERGLSAIHFNDEKSPRSHLNAAREDNAEPVLVEAERQLVEYFARKRKAFDLKLDFNGTEFQKRVWKILLDIPYGTTTSYARIAEQIGNPKATRAVGAANGRNPIAIIAACHRVIGSSGKLTGYAGGLKTKAKLLELEGRKLDGEPDRNSKVLN